MTEGCIQCFNVEERASTLNSICLKVINFNHKFGSIKMTLVAASGSLFSILDGIQLHPSFLSIFILTPSTKWNPSSSHEFFFANLELSGDSLVQSRVMRPQKLWVQQFTNFCFFMFSSILSPSWSPYSCWVKKQLFHLITIHHHHDRIHLLV